MRTALALVLPVVLAAQSALLEIKVIEGGGVHQPGSRTPGLSVEIADELGRPVAGAVVSLRLPDDGAGGSFANGLNSEILTTGSNGRATTSPVRWNRVPGPVEIRITAVKGQLRAGTLVTCELSNSESAKSGPASRPAQEQAVHKRLPVKWLVIGAVAAAAASVGFASGRSGSKTGAGTGTGPAEPPSTIQIGVPTITIGKP
jgi:hypothetical protein